MAWLPTPVVLWSMDDDPRGPTFSLPTAKIWGSESPDVVTKFPLLTSIGSFLKGASPLRFRLRARPVLGNLLVALLVRNLPVWMDLPA